MFEIGRRAHYLEENYFAPNRWDPTGVMQGFCIKCRRTKEIKNPRYVILDMRHAIQGICPWYGGKISRLIKSGSYIDEDTASNRIKTKANKDGKIHK